MCAKNRIRLVWEKAAHNITVRTGVVGVSWRHRSEDGEGYAQAFFIAVAFDFDSEILLKSLQPPSSRLIGIRDTGGSLVESLSRPSRQSKVSRMTCSCLFTFLASLQGQHR